MDLTELCSDPRFADPRAVRKNGKELIALLDAAFASRPLAEWAERFDAAKVWWCPVSTPSEVLTDQQLLDNEIFCEVAGAEGPIPLVPSPYRVLGHRPSCPPAPELGQDNSILQDRHEKIQYRPRG
jgi:crotonobetainyl-CoA:carnitine CoA-transferase CaiB-like acyl-CoA transferase